MLILYAPFIHIHVGVDTPGFGGYTYMMGFLWAIGYPITGLSFGLLNLYYAKKSTEDKRFRILLSYGVMIVAGFYIAIAFFPKTKEYTMIEYNLIFSSVSILGVFIISYISQKARLLEDTLRDKKKLNEALKLIGRLTDIHFMNVAVKARYSEINNRAMESDTTVKEDTDNMEEDLLTTYEEIAKL